VVYDFFPPTPLLSLSKLHLEDALVILHLVDGGRRILGPTNTSDKAGKGLTTCREEKVEVVVVVVAAAVVVVVVVVVIVVKGSSSSSSSKWRCHMTVMQGIRPSYIPVCEPYNHIHYHCHH